MNIEEFVKEYSENAIKIQAANVITDQARLALAALYEQRSVLLQKFPELKEGVHDVAGGHVAIMDTDAGMDIKFFPSCED